MSVAKVIEITSDSKEGFEAAIKDGIQRAGKTIAKIQGAWVKDQEVLMKDGQISGYRVNLKLTFVLED